MAPYFGTTALIAVWTLLAVSYVGAASCIDASSGISAGRQSGDPLNRNGNRYAFASFIAAAVTVLGAKFTLIQYYGSDLPFWDQWDTEPLLYIPFDQGKLLWSTLLSPHNEHRIFFSRLWALSLYAVNHQWDAHLQTVANAFLHTFFGLWLVWILWRLNEKKDLWIMLAVLVLILAVPFAWENTLFGFQSSFYFLLGFSSVAIWLIPQSRPFSLGWMLGILFALLSLFTMGAGLFAVLVSLTLVIVRAYRDQRVTWHDGITLIACLLVLLAGVLLMHVHEGHAVLRPKSFMDFMKALGKNLSWPWIDVPFLFPFLWSPIIILAYRICIHRKEELFKYPFFIVGLGLWTLLQCIAIAYSRGFEGSGPSSRYMDSLSLIPIVNILAAHYLYRHSTKQFMRRKGFLVACSFWYAFSVIGFLNLLINGSIEGFSTASAYLAKQTETVGRYLASEDDDVILKARHMEIPFPDSKKLSSILKDQTIRELLPISVRKPLAVVPSINDWNDFIENGFFPAMPVIKDKKTWGSYEILKGDLHVGSFRSEKMPPPRLPYLRFWIAGYLDNSMLRLELYGMDDQLITAVVPRRLPRESWKSVDIKSPQVPFYIKATDQAKSRGGWFAFTAPTEIGFLSLLSESILSAGRALLVIGLALMMTIMIYVHLQNREGSLIVRQTDRMKITRRSNERSSF